MVKQENMYNKACKILSARDPSDIKVNLDGNISQTTSCWCNKPLGLKRQAYTTVSNEKDLSWPFTTHWVISLIPQTLTTLLLTLSVLCSCQGLVVSLFSLLQIISNRQKNRHKPMAEVIHVAQGASGLCRLLQLPAEKQIPCFMRWAFLFARNSGWLHIRGEKGAGSG